MRIENPNISAVIITNDDLNCIKAVESVYSSVNEIIIVNTVKTRKVNEAVREFSKVRMFYFKWCDHYSKARNYGIRKAKGDWILTIDSDEVLQDKICYVDDKYLAYMSKQVSQGKGFPTARLFQNNKGIFYRNRVHETIDHAITPGTSCDSDIIVNHTGYDLTAEELGKKVAYYDRLMLKDTKNVIYNKYMGAHWFLRKDYNKAMSYFTKAMKDRLNDAHFAVIQNNIHACHFMLEHSLNVLIQTLRRSLVFEPFQFYARVNIIEHLLSVINEENKDKYVYQIRDEISKIERIFDYGLSNLLFGELEVTKEYINQKWEELDKWGIKKIAI